MTEAEQALTLTFTDGESAARVRKNLSLPLPTVSGLTITWAASDSAITIGDGVAKVTRAAADVTVNLTATIKKGSATRTKVFVLTVQGTDTEAFETAEAGLTVPLIFTANGSFSTPASVAGATGVTIAWSSDNAIISIASGTATVTQGTNRTTVKVKATLTKDSSATKAKIFDIVVYGTGPEQGISDAELVTAVFNSLALNFAAGDNAQSVIGNIGLTANLGGAAINWESSNAAVLKVESNTTAKPVRDFLRDTDLNLTATIKKGSETKTKDFALKIKGITVIDKRDSSGEGRLFTFSGSNSLEESAYRISDGSLKLKEAARYTYTIDYAKKELSLTQTSIYIVHPEDSSKSAWVSTKAEVVDFNLAIQEPEIQDILNYVKLSKRITIDTLKTAFVTEVKTLWSLPDDAKAKEKAANVLISGTVEAFDALNAADFKTKVQAFITNQTSFVTDDLGLPATATIQDIETKLRAGFREEAESEFAGADLFYSNRVFAYQNVDNNIVDRAAFMTGKAWHEQIGEWVSSDGTAKFYKSYGYYIFYFSGNMHSGNLNEDKTTFRENTGPDKDKIWTITPSADGKKITLVNGSDTYELNFNGACFFGPI